MIPLPLQWSPWSKSCPEYFIFENYRFLVFFTTSQGCDRAHVQKSEQFHNQHLWPQPNWVQGPVGPSWCWFACLWKYSAGDIFVKINFDIYIDFLTCAGIACGTTMPSRPGGNSQCNYSSISIWFLTNLVKHCQRHNGPRNWLRNLNLATTWHHLH